MAQQDLYLRKVDHTQARDNYRVILKIDETEFEVGSIGVKTFTSTNTSWTWGIDTVLPMCARHAPALASRALIVGGQ